MLSNSEWLEQVSRLRFVRAWSGRPRSIDHPVAQEHSEAGGLGEFQERECHAAHLDASERETGRNQCGNQKPKKSCQENEPNQGLAPCAAPSAANSTNKIAGETLTFAGREFSAAGLENAETIGRVTLTSAGTLSSAVAGPYSIVPSAPVGGTFFQGNYSDIFMDGTLTVLGAPELTLTGLGSQYVLTFQSVSGQAYQLQSRTNLTLGSWSSLGGSINGSGATVNVTNTVTVPDSFFQLQIMPQ